MGTMGSSSYHDGACGMNGNLLESSLGAGCDCLSNPNKPLYAAVCDMGLAANFGFKKSSGRMAGTLIYLAPERLSVEALHALGINATGNDDNYGDYSDDKGDRNEGNAGYSDDTGEQPVATPASPVAGSVPSGVTPGDAMWDRIQGAKDMYSFGATMWELLGYMAVGSYVPMLSYLCTADELRGDKTEVLVRLLTKLFYQGARPGAPAVEGMDLFMQMVNETLQPVPGLRPTAAEVKSLVQRMLDDPDDGRRSSREASSRGS